MADETLDQAYREAYCGAYLGDGISPGEPCFSLPIKPLGLTEHEKAGLRLAALDLTIREGKGGDVVGIAKRYADFVLGDA